MRALIEYQRYATLVAAAILAGDEFSGVSIMLLDEGMDSGPVLAEVRTPIASDETGGSLHDRLSLLAAELLAAHLHELHPGQSEAVWPDLHTGEPRRVLELTQANQQPAPDVSAVRFGGCLQAGEHHQAPDAEGGGEQVGAATYPGDAGYGRRMNGEQGGGPGGDTVAVAAPAVPSRKPFV